MPHAEKGLQNRAVCALGSLVGALFITLVPNVAFGQLHWDAGVSAGPMRRVLFGGNSAGDMGFTTGLDAHVALFPLLRVGAYATFDTSGANNEDVTRLGFSGGLHAKLTLPLMPKGWKGAFLLGLGYAFTARPEDERERSVAGVPTRFVAPSQTGGMLEIPLGIQTAYDLHHGTPKALGAASSIVSRITFQLGMRVAFAHHGSLFDDQTVIATDTGSSLTLRSAGTPTLSPFLLVGVSFDR